MIPDNVEKIIMTKEDYDRNVEQLLVEKMELQQELQEIKKEHSIMKEFIYENGLWEKFLNDDRFIEHLRSE